MRRILPNRQKFRTAEILAWSTVAVYPKTAYNRSGKCTFKTQIFHNFVSTILTSALHIRKIVIIYNTNFLRCLFCKVFLFCLC